MKMIYREKLSNHTSEDENILIWSPSDTIKYNTNYILNAGFFPLENKSALKAKMQIIAGKPLVAKDGVVNFRNLYCCEGIFPHCHEIHENFHMCSILHFRPFWL